MRFALLMIVAAAILAGGSSAYAGRPICCEARVLSPLDGATNVAVDVEVRFSLWNCGLLEPRLVGPAGKVVGLDVSEDPQYPTEQFLARPREALTAGTWEVHLGASSCGRTTDPASRFEVGGLPKLLGLSFATGAGESADCIDVMEIQLSEPTAEDPVSYIESSLPAVEVHGSTAGYVYWGFKSLAISDRPKASEPVTVRIRKELPFASGATLEKDLEVTVTPGAPSAPGSGRFGCSAASGSGLAGFAALLVFLRMKRRSGLD